MHQIWTLFFFVSDITGVCVFGVCLCLWCMLDSYPLSMNGILVRQPCVYCFAIFVFIGFCLLTWTIYTHYIIISKAYVSCTILKDFYSKISFIYIFFTNAPINIFVFQKSRKHRHRRILYYVFPKNSNVNGNKHDILYLK